jgi:uncharacterized protein YndB with AHSA1/START domain
MPDIRHRVAVAAPLDRVFEAAATSAGIDAWWTRGGVEGESRVGSRLEFYFGQPEPAAVMAVRDLDPAGLVAWDCVGGAEEWVGTTLRFELAEHEGQTVILFTHGGWRSASEFMAHCSARWAYFLLSLKCYVETGAGTPFPEDLKF